uniref:Sterile alpha motif domain-containing protein 3-like n=1 Tax=Knipowitschia caucasica TaxID=637954 RepID=A0AAV2JIT4_KNICA
MDFTTEELLLKLQESGINVTEEEAQRFREHEVDGEALECGLTDTMSTTNPPEKVPYHPYLALLGYTMYPTNAEYVQVVKALILKYPFLADKGGNGYNTWHQSLKRKFKLERAPLIHENEVKKSKEKFGRKRTRELTECDRPSRRASSEFPSVSGEDASSIEQHVRVLHVQYEKVNPDASLVEDRMQRTFSWRRKEIIGGMTVVDVLKKYPFLRSPRELCTEMDRMHPVNTILCQRWRQNLTKIVPKVIELAQGKSPLTKVHSAAREDILADDLQDVDFRAALILLPTLFKEKTERLFKTDAICPTPYPTVQLSDRDWETILTRRVPVSVVVDGTEVCQGTGVEEGIIAAFSSYYVFNLAYPPYLKNTLTFLQRVVLNISEVGEKPLPITVTRMINLLY